MTDTAAVPVLHIVTTDTIIARPDFVDVACALMTATGARGALHLRTSALSAAELERIAEGLGAVQAMTGSWLVINDRVDVALATGARGVQLTRRSLPVQEARTLTPQLALGASVHDLAEGRAAAAAGADWLVAGHVFATPSHPGIPPAGPDWVQELSRGSTPVLAIGGVTPDRIPALRALGVHGVAVIRGIWEAVNAEQAAAEYLSRYDDAASAR